MHTACSQIKHKVICDNTIMSLVPDKFTNSLWNSQMLEHESVLTTFLQSDKVEKSNNEGFNVVIKKAWSQIIRDKT